MFRRTMLIATSAMLHSPAEIAVDNTKKKTGKKGDTAEGGAATSSTRLTGIWRYRALLEGTSPMLQNPMTDAILDELLHGSAGRRKGVNKDLQPAEIIQKRICFGPEGEFGIPKGYLFASLVGAGRQTIFNGKAKMSTAEESKIPAFLSLHCEMKNANGDGFIPFVDQEVKPVIDKRKGNLKQGAGKGVAVALVRPKFMQWALDVYVDVDLDQIEITKVIELFTNAGRFSGLGDFRPSCKGEFGKFAVKKFSIVEQVSKSSTIELDLEPKAA